MSELATKEQLLDKLRAYAETPDNDNIRFKQKIKDNLMRCPELLYCLNEKSLESELFNSDGTINEDGEWDRYFGENSNIRPYLNIPQTQTDHKNFVSYQVFFNDRPKYNPVEKYGEIKFTIFVYCENAIDKLTGIPRHDLIAAIICDRFNWTNIFGTQCKLTTTSESTTDNNYIVSTLIFELTKLNSTVKTINGIPVQINQRVITR